MEDVAVEKDIRDKLPEEEIIPNHTGNKSEDGEHPFPGKMLQDKCYSTGKNNGFYDWSNRTAEGDV